MRREKVRQGERCLLPATVFLAGAIKAELRAFWRVNAIQPNALPVNFDGVTVDYRGRSDEWFGLGWPWQATNQHCHQEQTGDRFCKTRCKTGYSDR